MLLTFSMRYWQRHQPVARLLRLLIIDDLTCKSIMQTCRQPRRLCGKQTRRQTALETHTGALGCVASLRWAKSVLVCDQFQWLRKRLMPVKTQEWSHQLYISDMTIKSRLLRRTEIIVSGCESLPPQPQCDSSKQSWGAARWRRAKKHWGKQVQLRGSAPQPHATWQNNFHQRAQTHTHTQVHSTFNDSILSTKWRYPQLHSLNWRV